MIIVDEALAILICLALYLSLRLVHESLMLIATALSATPIVCYLIATPALKVLHLSHQYGAAATSAEREELIGAGQAVLSSWFGTPYQVGYVVESIGMLLIGLMMRSQMFSRLASYVGILSGAVAFGIYVPKAGVFISILSVVRMQVQYVMDALTLLCLSQGRLNERFCR